MLSTRLFFTAILHLLAVSRTLSQETLIPNSSLLVEEYNSDVSNRQNFCQENSDVQSDTIELRDALVGRTLNVGIVLENPFVNYVNGTEGITLETPGVMIEIWDELAKRAGFSWRDSFAFYNTPSGDKDWTDLLLWSIDAFDVSLDWWYRKCNIMIMTLDSTHDKMKRNTHFSFFMKLLLQEKMKEHLSRKDGMMVI